MRRISLRGVGKLNHSLIYPSYMPDAKNLRASLLFYKKISTIIPQEDSQSVHEKPYVSELINHLGRSSIGRFDPAFYYHEWYREKNAEKEINFIINKAKKDLAYKLSSELVRQISSGNLAGKINQIKALEDYGWRYLSMQKIPEDLIEIIIDKYIAVRAQSYQYEQSPILIHPEIAKFILVRLAKMVSETENVTPVSTEKITSGYFIYEANIQNQQRRANFIQLSLDVLVPDGIESMDILRYCDIRDEYCDVRENLGNLVNDIMVDINIDDERSFRRFEENTSDVLAELHRKMERAVRNSSMRNTLAMTVDITANTAGSALGAYLGGVGGAALGAGLGALVSKSVSGSLERRFPVSNRGIERFASLQSRIRSANYKPSIPYPYY
ncbi:hypothetical protein [Azospirillum sp. TSH64]|uniref:hypothetical protein n=1 Tax=Azospirillum sp. TSH64 TaxID=652740 RepID=UPI0011B289DA|nr:hypothetical protein [Azospirillum sp. TSH64]